jgi:lipopolysaccharide/colanic/teichoic acid biosynthesis glycosyltransferase
MTPCIQPTAKSSENEALIHLPAWKRSIDLICCLWALPFLAILTVIMTIVTKLVAPGPVFFRQERIGCSGRKFWIYKFRTMRVGADTNGHQDYFKQLIGTNAPMVKLDSRGDSRLIPGSRLLRASGLDELPQIINVLRREMSVVGPRPCIPGEYEAYQPWQRQRCDAMPGLTGLWQVSGKNRTTFEEMVHLDIRYGETKSWLLDLRIILMTVPALMVQIYDTRVRKTASPVPARVIPSVSMRNARSASPTS